MPKQDYLYAVGRRKSSTAVVKLFPKGSGKFTVTQANGTASSMEDYFGGNWYMLDNLYAPFHTIDKKYMNDFDAEVTIRGGGLAGQSDAIKLGFARALVEYNPELRQTLKPYGHLKRDGRIKERKKPGLRGARKRPTWSKR
ncbi:MAG: 30S ribosomal protein S9 [Candidatus Peribacteria bacterium]|nr:MAG: 30S ribosomal protein S9 [Candidatus Peribacteria bacterium]